MVGVSVEISDHLFQAVEEDPNMFLAGGVGNKDVGAVAHQRIAVERSIGTIEARIKELKPSGKLNWRALTAASGCKS